MPLMYGPRRSGRGRRLRRWVGALSAAAAVSGAAVAATHVVADASNASKASAHAPVGHFDSLTQAGDEVHVIAWAYDPDSASDQLNLWLDGVRSTYLTSHARPATAAKHPGHGVDLGVNVKLPVTKGGKHRVCIHAMDMPAKKHYTSLGCKTVNVAVNPQGAITSTSTAPGQLTVKGWTVDPDQQATSLGVTLLVDGTDATTGTANLTSPVAPSTTYPGAGTAHGFAVTVPITEGSHTVCVKAAGVGLGVKTAQVACKTVKVNFSPVGGVLSLKQARPSAKKTVASPGAVTLSGWASDPDEPTSPVTVSFTIDGVATGSPVVAGSDATGHTGHAFTTTLTLPGTSAIAPGKHRVCILAKNLGQYGKNDTVGCATVSVNFDPAAGIDSIAKTTPAQSATTAGAVVTGWATDPDTRGTTSVKLTVDGKAATPKATVPANGTGGSHSGHSFTATVALSDGTHTVCAVAVNVLNGTKNSAPACSSVSVNFDPFGHITSAGRVAGSTSLSISGWALDPDSATQPVQVTATVDGTADGGGSANVSRPDVIKAHPRYTGNHGYVLTLPTDSLSNPAGEHKVCISATNLGNGKGPVALGCSIVDAINPVAPSVPQTPAALAGYGGATISWTAPASDGGAPWSGYTITSSPGGITTTVDPTATSATITGLKPSTNYTFTVVATNVAGTSPAATTASVKTQAAPPPQTSPAPISTSRYTRNIVNSSASDLATMRREGAADAAANPSGHGYLILLDIGGQDDSRHGVLLSAGVRFVTYSDLVKNIEAYVDGYASKQKPSAPVTIAIGTNNDMDVSKSSGAVWANTVVDPVVSYTATRYPGVTIAGANDMEPGFSASYSATRSWLTGYLGATKAPFVFNGSADGCAWTTTNRGCNNGWKMSGLYQLAAGAAPIRILNLPQIYNDTMAAQWRYISLTGVRAGSPPIDFGGALTEWTACHQAGGCGSLTGNSAWSEMWSQLRAQPELKVSSLPYSTDLRIDR